MHAASDLVDRVGRRSTPSVPVNRVQTLPTQINLVYLAGSLIMFCAQPVFSGLPFPGNVTDR